MPNGHARPSALALLAIAILVLGAVWHALEWAAYKRWQGFYDWPAERIIYDRTLDGVDPLQCYPQFSSISEVPDMIQEWFGLGRYEFGYQRPAAVGSRTWHRRHNPNFLLHNGTAPSQPDQLPCRDASRR